jgi:hypothetical protein
MDLSTKQFDIAGKTHTLKMSTASSRIAKMKHDRVVDFKEMQQDPLGMQATLMWLALLPYQPDVTEEDAMMMLAQADNESEIVGWVTKEFMAFMDEMGKRLNQ